VAKKVREQARFAAKNELIAGLEGGFTVHVEQEPGGHPAGIWATTKFVPAAQTTFPVERRVWSNGSLAT